MFGNILFYESLCHVRVTDSTLMKKRRVREREKKREKGKTRDLYVEEYTSAMV